MSTRRSSNLSIMSIKTKPAEEKLISSRRLLSREISMKNTSCSEYYADASVAVPFRWESQPGTPKVKYCETFLPPLTPPPSYQFSTAKKNLKRLTKSSTLLNIVLPKLSFRKDHHHPQSIPASPLRWSPSSSSPSRSSFSVPSSPYNPKSRGQGGFSSPASSSFESSRVDDDDGGGGFGGSPVSTLCFGIGGRRSSATRSCGFSSSPLKIMPGELA